MNRRYRSLVIAHREALGDWFKMASDLAHILDHEVTQVKRVGNQWVGPLPQRFRAFTKLHRIFLNAKIDSPLTPEDGFSTLVSLHINLPPQHNLSAPTHRLTKVVIVDDAPDELIDSALVLIGVPNIQLGFFHYDYYNNLRKTPNQSLEEKLQILATRILSHDPDVILMDHSLGDIEGPSLVEEIKKQLDHEKGLVFIANTGGHPHALLEVGCSGNFRKGRQPDVFFQTVVNL
ncbi:response regulator transcription factor [Candidatus Uhrbacteria bacterium]|nr:response regulator transcription factor [Candidatus Uhrbacteria bacterium]